MTKRRIALQPATVAPNDDGTINIPTDVKLFFDALWPGLQVSDVAGVQLTQKDPKLKGFGVTMLTLQIEQPEQSTMLNVILVRFTISHPDSALSIRYERSGDLKSYEPEITLRGIGIKVENSEIRSLFPLLTLLRKGRPFGRTDKEREAIVNQWRASDGWGKGGNELEKAFARQHGISDRTLRRWTKKFPDSR